MSALGIHDNPTIYNNTFRLVGSECQALSDAPDGFGGQGERHGPAVVQGQPQVCQEGQEGQPGGVPRSHTTGRGAHYQANVCLQQVLLRSPPPAERGVSEHLQLPVQQQLQGHHCQDHCPLHSLWRLVA